MPHNVQVAPDGKNVWVTGNAMEGHMYGLRLVPKAYTLERDSMSDTRDDRGHGQMPDELIVIDPTTDTISKRVPIGSGMHLAHVVLTPDSAYAYATSEQKDLVIKINALTYLVEKRIELKKGSGPHGMRIYPDGKTAYIAMSTGKGLGMLELPTNLVSVVPLKGQGIQAGVTPDGRFAVVSVYDTKSLGIYDVVKKKLTYADLPEDAKGPIQMYPTPDSRFVYLADQGNYFNQPNGNKVYKIDLDLAKVVAAIPVGAAPHGVVVSKDGKRVYVTDLVSGELSIIDATRDVEINRLKVGDQPNGVSIWAKNSGGTP